MKELIITLQGTISSMMFINRSPRSLLIKVIMQAEEAKYALYFFGDMGDVFSNNQPHLGETLLKEGSEIQVRGQLIRYDKHAKVHIIHVTEILATSKLIKVTLCSSYIKQTLFFAGSLVENSIGCG